MGWWATLYKFLMFQLCLLRLLARLPALKSFDLVIIHRELWPLGGVLLEKLATRLNARIIYDLDDAVWLPMPLKVDQRRLFGAGAKVEGVMALSAGVVAGNEYIAAHARRHNPRVRIIPTPYRDLGGKGDSAALHGPPVVVWIGNVGNGEYLELLRGPLEALALKHDFVFRIIGSEELSGLRMAVRLEVLRWDESREAEWLLGSSIGIMPLVDREYEKGKCAFKLVQYFSCGLPVVASPVGMNSQVVQHGCNGYLAGNEKEWHDCLDSLLSDRSLRQNMGREAYRSYREHFTIERNAHRWIGLFEELLKRP